MPREYTSSNQVVELPANFRHYLLKETIGRGPNSIVKVCINQTDKSKLAIKIVPLGADRSEQAIEKLTKPLKVVTSLSHLNILEVYDFFVEGDFFIIVMELCSKGSLYSMIVEKGSLSEQAARPIIRQICSALSYLHSMKFVLRSLDLSNVLLTDDYIVKLSNFGNIHILVQHMLLTSQCGSPLFAPPEVVRNEPYDGIYFDIWSLGVLLYTAVAGVLPWSDTNPKTVLQQISRAEFKLPTSFSLLLQDLIISILVVDPSKRISVEGIIRHPWFTLSDRKPVGRRTTEQLFNQNPSSLSLKDGGQSTRHLTNNTNSSIVLLPSLKSKDRSNSVQSSASKLSLPKKSRPKML